MADAGSTKRALAGAMKELMCRRPFAKISVGDICDLCRMNRKSFYYHFRDKYDLVNWIYYTEFVSALREKNYENGWQVLEDICRYFYENRKFYDNALQVTGQNSFRDYFVEVLQPVVMAYQREVFSGQEEAAFFAEFYTDAFLAAIQKWLGERSPRPPEVFLHLLRTALTGVALHMREDETE